MADPQDDLPSALAVLARGLAGAIDVGGFEHLPRPMFARSREARTVDESIDVRAASDAARPPHIASAPAVASSSSPSSAPPPHAAPVPRVPSVIAGSRVDAAERSAVVPAIGAAPSTLALAASLEELVRRDVSRSERLRILEQDVIGPCTRCKLHRARTKIVFGVGNPDAELVFVGEGPGADEDRQGVPFVGRAGQLLTKMIGAMGFSRDEVYICNVVKCRPPNNRDPEPDEVEACEGFLQAQLGILKPRAIVGLGRHACQTLLRTRTPITQLRGRWASYRDVPLMPTYHPSYLLREENDPQQVRKREAWSDLQLVMRMFGREPPRKN